MLAHNSTDLPKNEYWMDDDIISWVSHPHANSVNIEELQFGG